MRKGVYPYDYVEYMKKLSETSLPPKDAFNSKRTGEGMTDEDYHHAHTVWKEFNIETMKDYDNLYTLSDVLAKDIFLVHQIMKKTTFLLLVISRYVLKL